MDILDAGAGALRRVHVAGTGAGRKQKDPRYICTYVRTHAYVHFWTDGRSYHMLFI